MAASRTLMPVGDFAEDDRIMVPWQTGSQVGNTRHGVCRDDAIRTALHGFEGNQT